MRHPAHSGKLQGPPDLFAVEVGHVPCRGIDLRRAWRPLLVGGKAWTKGGSSTKAALGSFRLRPA